MSNLGRADHFISRPWPEVRDFLSTVAWLETPDYLFEIIDSVIDSGAAELLAVTTSMHDLVIAPLPVGEPPNDVVIVRAPGSLNPGASAGLVRIDHVAASGRNTSIEGPPADAVSLFWRVVRTELGIEAGLRSDEPGGV